ncbi:MAG: response regulator transcription factor [Bacteroidota bacterium]
MNEYQVLIVEDEILVAEDIKECLEEVGFGIAAMAHDATSAMRALKERMPDIVLLDINLKDKINGIELAQHINQYYRLPFVFLTSYADKSTIEAAKSTFPMGYLVKPFDSKDLLSALEITLMNFNRFQQQKQPLSLKLLNKKVFTPLTDREFEVLRLLLQGRSNKEMATELFVSVNTIKTHLSNIYMKLDVDSRAKVLAFVSKLLQRRA